MEGGVYPMPFFQNEILPAVKDGKDLSQLPGIGLEEYNNLEGPEKYWLGHHKTKLEAIPGYKIPMPELFQIYTKAMLDESVAMGNEDDLKFQAEQKAKPKDVSAIQESLSYLIGAGDTDEGFRTLRKLNEINIADHIGGFTKEGMGDKMDPAIREQFIDESLPSLSPKSSLVPKNVGKKKGAMGKIFSIFGGRKKTFEGHVPNFNKEYHPTAILNKYNSKTQEFDRYKPVSLEEKIFDYIGKWEDPKLYEDYLASKKDPKLLNKSLQSYLPTPNDVPTIGFGRTGGVNMQTTSTLEKEISNFKEEIKEREEKVRKLVTSKAYDKLSDNQKISVNSLAYNVGLGAFGRSQALKELKEGDFKEYLKEASEFRLQDGQVLQGLVRRRKDEDSLFNKEDPIKLEDTHRKLSKGYVPNFRSEENNKIANKLAFNRLTREGRFLHDEKVKESLIDSFKSNNTDSRPLGEFNPFAPMGHPEGEPLPMLRSERSEEEQVMGENTLIALPPRHDITGGIGQTLNLGMRTLGTSLHQTHFDNNTAGQVLRAAYPDIMKEVGGVDELVGGLGEETVIKMLKRAAKERMTGGDLENMVSFLASVGTTKMGPLMGPLAGALATSAQVDDFQSETFYGTAAGEGREAANMAPLLPVKKILKTLRSFNLRGPRVAQLGQGLDKANATNVISQGADAVSDLAGITDLDTFIDSEVRPDKSGLKKLKGLSEEEIKDLIAKPTDKRFQMNLLNNKGYVPNFADPLTDAIQREQLHVPNYAVRVGQDKALSSTQNPLGLGVYNTFDEPMGLNQGVTRAKSEGQNPKTYGLSSTLAARGNVPNFYNYQTMRDRVDKMDRGETLQRLGLPPNPTPEQIEAADTRLTLAEANDNSFESGYDGRISQHTLDRRFLSDEMSKLGVTPEQRIGEMANRGGLVREEISDSPVLPLSDILGLHLPNQPKSPQTKGPRKIPPVNAVQSPSVEAPTTTGASTTGVSTTTSWGVLPRHMAEAIAPKKKTSALITAYQNNPTKGNLERVRESFNNLSASQQKDLVTWNQRPNQIPREKAQRYAHATLFGHGAKVEGGKPGGILGNRFKVQADIKKPITRQAQISQDAARVSASESVANKQRYLAKESLKPEFATQHEKDAVYGPVADKIKQAKTLKEKNILLRKTLQFKAMKDIEKKEFIKKIISQKQTEEALKGRQFTQQQALAQYLIEAEYKMGSSFDAKDVLSFINANPELGIQTTRKIEKEVKEVGPEIKNKVFYAEVSGASETLGEGVAPQDRIYAYGKDLEGANQEIKSHAKVMIGDQESGLTKRLADAQRRRATLIEKGTSIDAVDQAIELYTSQLKVLEKFSSPDVVQEFRPQFATGNAIPKPSGVEILGKESHAEETIKKIEEDKQYKILDVASKSAKQLSEEKNLTEAEAQRVLNAVAMGPDEFDKQFSNTSPQFRETILRDAKKAGVLDLLGPKYSNNEKHESLIKQTQTPLGDKGYAEKQSQMLSGDPVGFKLTYLGASAEQRQNMIDRVKAAGPLPHSLAAYATESAIQSGIVENFQIPQEEPERSKFLEKVDELRSRGILNTQDRVALALSDDLFDAAQRPSSFTGKDIPNFALDSNSIIEKTKAMELGYEAGDIKEIPNFVYNDKETLLKPEVINDRRVRGLGTPMMNTEGTLAVSPAIVPPPSTQAFKNYIPNLASQMDMPMDEARDLVSTPKKSFAAGGALPKIKKVPNFAAEEKPETGNAPAEASNIIIENLGGLNQAVTLFDGAIGKLEGIVTNLANTFQQGFTTNFDGTINVNGLGQQFQSMKSDIIELINDKINNIKKAQNSNIFGTPKGIKNDAPLDE